MNTKQYHRRSIRLKGFNYSSDGAYFVTICTQDREMLFGDINNGKMVLNDIGKMVNYYWFQIPVKFPSIELGQSQIMPNHIHGIIFICRGGPMCPPNESGLTRRSTPTINPTLGTIIQWFKTMTTNNYINNVKNLNWVPFDKRVWQRNYYEHIIRNEKDLNKISKYILNNPLIWYRDRNNPQAKKDLTPY